MLEPFGTASLPERIWDEENIMPLGANKAAIMGVAGVSAGDVVLLSSQTASNDASIEFTSGIDSTYGEYIFKFYNIDTATEARNFSFQGSIDGGSNYNVEMTSTVFVAAHNEADATPALEYEAGNDQAQGTAYQLLMNQLYVESDLCGVGELHLFNPSSTTYAKHFIVKTAYIYGATTVGNLHVAGYFNTTSAINAMSFKMLASGNIAAGKIKMWGVK